MAFDRGLEERLYEYFQDRPDLEVKKMFGGLCYLLSEHMCCAIIDDKLMLRVGPKNYAACLAKPYAKEMDFTGKPIKTMVYITANGFESDTDLFDWLTISVDFIDALPPKRSK